MEKSTKDSDSAETSNMGIRFFRTKLFAESRTRSQHKVELSIGYGPLLPNRDRVNRHVQAINAADRDGSCKAKVEIIEYD